MEITDHQPGSQKEATPPPADHQENKLDRATVAELLMSAAHAMHSTLKLTELYDLVLDTLLSLTGVPGAILLLQRPRTHHPIIYKLRHGDNTEPVDLPVLQGRRFLEWLQSHPHGGVPFEDVPEVVREEAAAAANVAIPTVRWIEMSSQGRLLGVLGVIAGQDGFGPRADALLAPLAEQATIALDNAILYRRAKRESLENQTLLEASRLLMSSLDLDEVLEAIMDSLQKVVPYNAAGIFLVGAGNQVERIVDRGYDAANRSTLNLKAGTGLVGWVASSGQPLVINDVTQDPRYQNARVSTRSEMVAPICAGDRLVGVFNLERDVVDGFFEADLDLVQAFAQHVAVAIERARMYAEEIEQRRIRSDLEAARQIQRTFLPAANPHIPGYDIAGINISSEEVGGDYYDFIDIVEGQIGIAIADSSGKGIPAALIMAAFRASLIAEIRNNYALRSIMQKVNRLLCERNENTRFVTTIYGVLDAQSRVFTFSNAGHNPGVLRRNDGSIVCLEALGTALGIFPDAVYEEQVIALSPGDILLLYTDGVTDAFDSEGEAFELDRLIDVLQQHPNVSAEGIINAIRDAVNAFVDPDAPVDDFTMIVMRVL